MSHFYKCWPTGIALIFCFAISLCADPITIIAGSVLQIDLAGQTNDFGSGYIPRSASASASVIYTLSNDGTFLDVRFRNTSSGFAANREERRWLDEFSFITNAPITKQGDFIAMPVGAKWRTQIFTTPSGPGVYIGTPLPLWDGNGLIQGEEGWVRFSLDAPVTTLSINQDILRVHFISVYGGHEEFVFGINMQIVKTTVTPPVAVYEPTTFLLLGTGLLLIRRKKCKKV